MTSTTVYFATNRRPNDPANPTDFTTDIAGDVNSFRVGTASLDGDDLFKLDVDELAGAVKIAVAPETMDPDNAAKSKFGSADMFAQIRAEMLNDADALLHVHGYNYTFREAMARAVQVRQWLTDKNAKKNLVMMVFSWPSLGAGVSPKTYDDERVRANASGAALGRAIMKATDFIRGLKRGEQCGGRIHILAHSMGNYALRSAVQHMRTFVGDNIPPLFSEVLLLAADDDYDTLNDGKKMAPLLRGCKRVSVYYNRVDDALKASDVAMGNPDRLGGTGPEDLPALRPKVTAIAVASAIDPDADPTGHQYYRTSPAVRRDMLGVLSGATDEDVPGRLKGQADGLYLLQK
jgi:esterase/lipase superfamily enzyme